MSPRLPAGAFSIPVGKAWLAIDIAPHPVIKSDQFSGSTAGPMPFQKIEAEKLSDAVIRQIEGLILQGVLSPSERLPSERDMAEAMGVSRPSLREALSRLQEDGLLVARPGSGIYVAEILGSAFSPALVRLIARHPRATADYLAFRKDLEGLAAERAAQSAGDVDLQVIDAAFRRMQAAHLRPDPQAEAALDAAFHMAIIEAGHNVVALHMMRSMQELLQAGVFRHRSRIFASEEVRERILRQHEAINTALQTRDGTSARARIEEHLDYVAEQLTIQQRADEQAELARLRLRHAGRED